MIANPNRIYITRDESEEAEVVLRFQDCSGTHRLDMTREVARGLIQLLQDAVDKRVYPTDVDPEGDVLDAEYFGPGQRRKGSRADEVGILSGKAK